MSHGVYIHIPFCRSKCGYCSFTSTADLMLINRYIDALKAEIKVRGDKNIQTDTVYIGGGTPSVLPCGAIEDIIDCIRQAFNLKEACEITVEANPESCGIDFVSQCLNAGVNRISMGLQSTDDKLLKVLGRPHTFKDFLKSQELLINSGIVNLSADLMTGLPSQKRTDFIKSLKTVVNLPLKHLSVYALSIEEGTPFHRLGIAVDEELQAQMYDDCVKILDDNGFERYEVSNFAKKGFESRHNSKYWNLSPYTGLGLSAHSYLNKTRIENTDNLTEYLCGKTENRRNAISREETQEEYIMLALRTREGIDCQYLKNILGYDLLKDKQNEIKNLISINALSINENRLKATNSAFYILNSIITELIK